MNENVDDLYGKCIKNIDTQMYHQIDGGIHSDIISELQIVIWQPLVAEIDDAFDMVIEDDLAIEVIND